MNTTELALLAAYNTDKSVFMAQAAHMQTKLDISQWWDNVQYVSGLGNKFIVGAVSYKSFFVALHVAASVGAPEVGSDFGVVYTLKK